MTHHALVGALLLMLLGCSGPRLRELGEVACHNGMDDDHDGLWDCADPDCFGAAACGTHPSMDAGAKTKLVDMDATPGAGGANIDAGGSAAFVPIDAAADEDGGATRMLDATVAPPPPCDPACAIDQECIDHKCQGVAVKTPGEYTLTIVSVVAPDQSYTSACYDYPCDKPLSFVGIGLCPCPVDPYVVVVLVSAGKEVMRFMTPVVTDDPNATFPPTPFTLQLMQGDVLRFEVWDHDDPPNPDDKLFDCKPDLTNVMPGPLSCSTMAGPLNAQLVSVTADLQLGATSGGH
jgi:hypothetical protein